MLTRPTPKGSSTRDVSPLRFLWGRRKPLQFIEALGKWPGDVSHARIGSHSLALLKHPDLVQQLLVVNAGQTEKGRTAERELFFQFLGNGLLNSVGTEHRRQRRLVLPAFHRNRLSGYATQMVAAAEGASSSWRSGEIRDMSAEMMGLTLTIVGRTLFSADSQDSARIVAENFSELTRNLNQLTLPGAKWLLRSPLPFARRIRNTRANLENVVRTLIDERRASGEDTGDLLSMLLIAEDADKPGERLSTDEVRDQVMTLFFAGHETTANALTWVWWLLAQHPAQEDALHAELRRVLGGRPPTFADVPNLTLTEQIVSEVLRLYPPVWSMGRRTFADLQFADCMVPRDSLVVASQWQLHRDPRWYDAPAAFRPERWTTEFRSSLPRFAYFPFGGGPRSCVGEHFAWTELILVIATLAQQWSFQALRQTPEVRPQARITLHPDQPVKLCLRRR